MSRRFKRRRSLKERDRRAEPPHGGRPVVVFPTRFVHAPGPEAIAHDSAPWCMRTATYTNQHGHFSRGPADPDRRFPKVRCPRCGRRLRLMTVDIEHGYGDFWPYYPPHKIRKTKHRHKIKRTRSGPAGRASRRGS